MPQPRRWDEKAAAMALLSAQNARVGAASPAALLVCDQYLIRDLWLSLIHSDCDIATELWAWGSNKCGQLGIGDDKTARSLPTEITAVHNKQTKQVACGANHSMVLLTNGELWTMGSNNDGQLGLDGWQNRTTPEPVVSLAGKSVVSVACGELHTIAMIGLDRAPCARLFDNALTSPFECSL